MLVSVRLFAGLRERAGASHVDVELPDDATVADLLAALELAPRSCVAAINREYADGTARIAPGDEVALVPPVSGGDATVRRIRVTGEALDVAALSAAVRDPRAGAVVVFEGVTRTVPELEYEAYVEMAEPRLTAIAAEEAERHGLCARRRRAPHGHRAARRAERDRGRQRGASRRGVRRRARRDRPRQGGGADLEGRGRRRRPPARRGDAPPGLMDALTIGEAARAIGVSADTLRRWDRAGKLDTVRDERNRRRVPQREIERLSGRPQRHAAGDRLSARNRFAGVVRSVEVDGVMALVEIEAGPFLVTAAVTRDAVEELGLAPGVAATAAVKATSVMVERGGGRA